ncbi:hypothetical protein [Cognataquiflexum rubidum]|uniref:hypothetical protein n=1 Tax=Cognataquiflexum rubidum TaxID=2922273 RepID=UPI001F12BC09|nr:hypothetical protein [Cognataquiflexum rubidum]MCH6234622.1 hypothetical protein [Cognataquiflexum rubidum]
MREQFDKKLVNKIKSSFKEMEGEFDASEWDKFSKIYFRKEAKPKLLWVKWVSGIAAAILLGFSLNAILQPTQTSPTEDQNLITETRKDTPIKKENIESRGKVSIPPPSATTTIQPDSPELAEKPKTNGKGNFGNSPSPKPGSKDAAKNLAFIPERIEKTILPENQTSEKTEILLSPSTDLIAKKEVEQMTQQEAIEQIQEWKGENTLASTENEIQKEALAKEPMKLGVMVAPQTISNSTQSLNLGAGLMSEFSFSKKLKLDVGMAFARQNISPSSGGGNYLSANVSNNADAQNLKASAFTGNVINTSRELSFGQLDIPINLKYKVMDKKESDIYLISGLSNMFYLNQQDVTTFSTANLATANFVSNQQMVNTFTQTIVPDSQSSGINTGRMVNFGVGFEQNLKNGTFLSIEPFYKLPLGNQTFTNQQFSMGGINLRMNFQLKTKKE